MYILNYYTKQRHISPFLWLIVFCERQYPLGISGQQERSIPDGSIEASSRLSSLYDPKYARLRGSRSWCGTKTSNVKIWVDLEKLVTVSGVATQGSKHGRVIGYNISYSYDIKVWYGYPSNAIFQVWLFQVYVLLYCLTKNPFFKIPKLPLQMPKFCSSSH